MQLLVNICAIIALSMVDLTINIIWLIVETKSTILSIVIASIIIIVFMRLLFLPILLIIAKNVIMCHLIDVVVFSIITSREFSALVIKLVIDGPSSHDIIYPVQWPLYLYALVVLFNAASIIFKIVALTKALRH